ncbi:polyamine-transporting ATPase [Agaricicola taiwanensis]|uniref:Spermidine/putrescine import ATP-binding protein PotA n=1 Tax=Agaricicola taiwanensis TaxID=591372 RepID=A0A8J2YKY9_9RHOB|nr:ABC transporter ATP-binding protein [Agaricicola taiwanensis]GGE49776.1 polyamine-transporting ATPase [Agaricicola taiwanensis]
MAIVKLEGISKKYGDFIALDHLDLTVEKGEFLTLLGPSGSGKTTLLNIIAGMIQPSSGAIRIDGRDVTNLPTRQRGLGMVFQNYALMPHMSVFENVAFPLRVRRAREEDIRTSVSEVLKIVNLLDFARRKPHELSGGQQQRVAIARCLVYKPGLILMDEPLGALDKNLREQLQFEIKRLHSELGVTILYVTHDQEEALALSDRIILMNNGRVEQLGTPHDLYFHPQTVFAAQFLGESNVLAATVAGHDGEDQILNGKIGAIRSRPTSIAAGTEATVIVRPENIRRLRPGEHLSNEISGDLIETTFVGDATKYYVKTDNDTIIILKQLANAIPEDAGDKRVRIGWAAEHTLVLQKNV